MVRHNPLRPPRSGAVFDELLVVLAQSHDRTAFEQLHRRWNARLTRAAARYTGDADSAHDLAQECWLAIWKGLGRLQDPAHFRAYMFGVLHRRGADHLRRSLRTRSREQAAPFAEPGAPPAQHDRHAIAQAFALLPPEQRLAAHLFFVEGCALAEIAEAQAIPLGTAKSRLFHARRALKAALADLPEGDLT
jgi:RNA polymerase sigma-70 factor (ECF subfamily)